MEKNKKLRSYKDIIEIPDDLKKDLPTSYDIVGDIALLKLNKDLYQYKENIGKTMIEISKNIKTVCLIKPVKGELRTREIEIIAGEKKTETIHKEYGLIFKLDVSKVYFSSRLSSERKRVADLVKNGEVIIDMFAGIGPFSIMIAKYANPKIIYTVDKNKKAVEYAQFNITKNNVLDKIELFHDDVSNFTKIFSKKKLKVDRVIMNLPFKAFNFINNVLKISKDYSIIHYYDILNKEDINQRVINLRKLVEKNNYIIERYDLHKIKSYSPREFYIGFDITVKKTK
jgi:tRNA (guanine37-N1)-methyltransferase